MELLKVLARYLKYEVEDPTRLNEGLLDAYMLLFDEYQNFFRNHKIDIPAEEKKDDQIAEDSKAEDSKADSPNIDIEKEGATDLKDDEKDYEGENDQEMSHEPENLGGSGATSNVAEADGRLPNYAIEDMEHQNPEITVQDANLLDLDDGNNADTEGWPDDVPENSNNPNNEYSYPRNRRDDDKFVPDPEYEYGFDPELHCMIYTGPDFKVGDMVDAIKIEPNTHANIQCWEQAQIIAEDLDTFTIRFYRDEHLYDRQIRKEHYRTVLFKLETHTRENYWRYQSQNELLGTLVDYYSIMYDCWCKAKVTAIFTNLNDTVDNVLLDVVEVPSMYKSSFYSGEDNKYPQLSIRSPCIRRTREVFLHTDEEMELQEMNQGVSSQRQQYGPQLPSGPYSLLDKNKNKRSIQIQVTEYFYEIGGHLEIIKRIQDVENALRAPQFVQLLKVLMCIGQHCSTIGDQTFGQEFEKAFLKYVNEGLEKSIKEFKYDYFDTMNTRMKKIFTYPESETKKIVIFYLLEIGYKCLVSDFLSVRVNGCK